MLEQIIALREQKKSYKEISTATGQKIDTLRHLILFHRPDLRHVIAGKHPPRNQQLLDKVIEMKKLRHTQAEIADTVSITREYVRQLVNKHLPELAGKEMLELSCEVCSCWIDASDSKAFAWKDWNHKGRISICRQCLKVIKPYKAALSRVAVYQDRYNFIESESAAGFVVTWIGPIYYQERGLQVEPNSRHPNWSSRIRILYRGAVKKVATIEKKYPWVVDFYERHCK